MKKDDLVRICVAIIGTLVASQLLSGFGNPYSRFAEIVIGSLLVYMSFSLLCSLCDELEDYEKRRR